MATYNDIEEKMANEERYQKLGNDIADYFLEFILEIDSSLFQTLPPHIKEQVDKLKEEGDDAITKVRDYVINKIQRFKIVSEILTNLNMLKIIQHYYKHDIL